MATGLTRQYYPRGGQGTFVYAPDIAVFIQTQENGIIDLSPKIIDFNLERVVNNVSSFSCTFDNKYAIYDRRIRRMDRIVVFLKRVSWMQVFSGYITEAPWQTIVPGNATLRAECTLKRLKHSYFDVHSIEGNELFPFLNSTTDWETTDGGAALTLVRLLTRVALWDLTKIQIQKIPSQWLERAVKLAARLSKHTEESETTAEFQSILQAFNNLVDASGWQGYFTDSTRGLLQNGQRIGDELAAGVGNYSDAQWKEFVGKNDVNIYPANSGNVALTGGYIASEHPEVLFSVQVSGTVVNTKENGGSSVGNTLYLRMDAADALAKLLAAFRAETNQNWDIDYGYLGFAKAKEKYGKANSGVYGPVNDSDFTWGTAIKVTANSPLYRWLNDPKQPERHVKWGWYKLYDPKVVAATQDALSQRGFISQANISQSFVFRGSPKYWDSTGRPEATQDETNSDSSNISAYKNLSGTGGPTNTFSDASVFSFMFFYPGTDFDSNILSGDRAWINDVAVLDYIQQVCGASQRDFMSAPNGDFIAFFPDRLGQYANFPALRVRDIEVVDIKSIISDDSLVTHYISYGEFDVPTGASGHSVSADTFFTGGMITLEQPDVLQFLLGLPEDEASDVGSQIQQLFGIRPRTDQAYYIRNRGYNFAVALHKFQEFWANQWRYFADFTFLPEIYPGMRIELVDRVPYPVSVYVESVSHTGNRISGFNTSIVFSTPTFFKDGRWTLLKPEIAPNSPLLPRDEEARADLTMAIDVADQKAEMFAGGIYNVNGTTGTTEQAGGRTVT